MFRVPEQYRVKNPVDLKYRSTENDGNNGVFSIKQKNARNNMLFLVVASDAGGWEHVSVTLPVSDRSPTWEEMCFIKDLFWDKEDAVLQFHPPESEYVNLHPHCLHLWKPVGVNIELPPSMFVGPKLKD